MALSDYGWQIKTWNLDEVDKKNKWMEKYKNVFQMREIFVNNKLALEYKRLLSM